MTYNNNNTNKNNYDILNSFLNNELSTIVEKDLPIFDSYINSTRVVESHKQYFGRKMDNIFDCSRYTGLKIVNFIGCLNNLQQIHTLFTTRRLTTHQYNFSNSPEKVTESPILSNSTDQNYKSSLQRNSCKPPIKLSNFLEKISTIISENKDDPEQAQLLIEESWLDFSIDDSNDLHSSISTRQNSIIDEAFGLLDVFFTNGNLNKTIHKSLRKYVVNRKFLLLTFSFLISYYNRTSLTNIENSIGVNISFHIYKENFTVKKTKTGKIRKPTNQNPLFENFSDFKNYYKLDTEFFVKLGNIFVETFTTPLNRIFQRVFNDGNYIITVNNEYLDEIRNNLVISPQSLPMICKPAIWSENDIGGKLLNKDEEFQKGLIIGSIHHGHKTKLNEKVYNTINYLNSLQFKVNQDLINYLENDGSYILDYYRKSAPHHYINNVMSLDIAKTYLNTPFYLNVNLDWRGRIYTQSFYLDYQASEFSLALINLSKGQKITEKGCFFLNVYGANIYNEDKIVSKKSFQERNEWVLKNLEKIYNMDPEFILNAESPALFASFCLTMKKLKMNPDSEVYFPVFLDATCSGVQHFAAMLLDIELANYVNLINSGDEVNDFYSKLIPEINNAINQKWLDGVEYYKFRNIKLDRTILKKIIMTKSYNVTTYGITEQLKSKLEKVKKTIFHKNKEIIVYDYKVPSRKKDEFEVLDVFEVEKLADVINDNIFNQFPSLHSIYSYLTSMAKILIKLDLPISWSTPLGLVLTQRYNLSKIQKITINFIGKNRTAVLRKWTSKNDTKREVQAIIPNIIHSLDAAHLINVINRWNNEKYILPIHDCFGTHPNDMLNLADLVRYEFVSLYSERNFLEDLDQKFRKELESHKVEVVEDNGVKKVKIVGTGRKKDVLLDLPILPTKGDLNIKDIIEKGKNMIT